MADILKPLNDYATRNGEVVDCWEQLICPCGDSLFQLYSDDNEGGAYCVCPRCRTEHDIENSRNYVVSLVRNVCSCNSELLEIYVGKSVYPDTTEPKWVYVGGACPRCGVIGVYVDWHER